MATLRERVEFCGYGVHTGSFSRLVLLPKGDKGIVFVRDGVEIPATWEFVEDTTLSTSLGRLGKKVSTVEHLLGVFFLLGIDRVLVLVEGEEIPIMDGSGGVFYEGLKDKVVGEREGIYLIEGLSFGDYSAKPSRDLRVSCQVSSEGLGSFFYEFKGRAEEVVYARTFCAKKNVRKILSLGKGKGASLENTLILEEGKALNPMRFEEEPARHKILDFLGDLYLLGQRLIAFYSIKNPGHSKNLSFVLYLKEKLKFLPLLSLTSK